MLVQNRFQAKVSRQSREFTIEALSVESAGSIAFEHGGSGVVSVQCCNERELFDRRGNLSVVRLPRSMNRDRLAGGADGAGVSRMQSHSGPASQAFH